MRGGKVGSMNRPAAAVGIVFEEDFDVGAIELVGWHDAKFIVDLEEDDGAMRVRASDQAAFWARVRSWDI